VRRSDQTKIPELYMKLRDPEKLKRLMDIQGVSQRELSIAAGWRSHTYLARLLNENPKPGERRPTGVKTKPAARIARHLGVGIDDLFVTRLSTDTAQIVKRRRAA